MVPPLGQPLGRGVLPWLLYCLTLFLTWAAVPDSDEYYCGEVTTGINIIAQGITTVSVAVCSQFFGNVSSRTPLQYEIEDNFDLGWVLEQFERPAPDRHPSRHTIALTSGDTDIISFDYSNFSLVLKGSPRPKLGSKILVHGKCVDYIYPLSYQFDLNVSVHVTVLDANDPPQLSNLPATVYVLENVTVGTVLHTVELDTTWDITTNYAEHDLVLESVTAQGAARSTDWHTFELTNSGQVVLHQPLDFEQGPQTYKLQISATDRGEPPLSSSSFLIVNVQDVDDMGPAFTDKVYYAEVLGERSVGDIQECFNTTPPVHAEDEDRYLKSAINFELVEGNPGTKGYWGLFFRVDVLSGVLCQMQTIQRLVRDEETDRLTFYNFTFTVKAYQTDNPEAFDTATIFVHVLDSNQHAPVFSRKRYRTKIKEYPGVTFRQKVVQLRAEDKDHGLNGEFEYHLVGNPLGAFAIDHATGEVTVLRAFVLDREKNSILEFQAMVKETGTLDIKSDTCRVVVELEDMNDNAPVFKEDVYNYTNVKNTLKNGFALVEYGQRVQATDVDAGDNGEVLYSITAMRRSDRRASFSDLGRFAIDPESGIMRLAGTLQDLRRRREYPEFIVEVTATDRARDERHRKSSIVDVHIHIREANEYAPEIPNVSHDGSTAGHLVVNASEDLPIGAIVVKIQAEDKDGDEDVYLSYNITKGNDDDFFIISSVGWVSLRKSLDRETQSVHDLEIQVSDGVHIATASLAVHVTDVNDNPPSFDLENIVFTLVEESRPGTVVGSLLATDPDLGPGGWIRYALRETDQASKIFAIEQNGDITVTKFSELLDREKREKIILKVIASDQGAPSLQTFADVTILLIDRNDNSPVFSTPFYKGAVQEDDVNPRPQTVQLDIPVSATDGDTSLLNRDVVYTLSGNGSEFFDMDPKTAEIVVMFPGSIDCEKQTLYTMQVRATDHAGVGLSSTATLLIEVQDINDNAPVFEDRPSIILDRRVKIDDVVGDVKATDGDVTPPNNDVIYLLRRGGYGKFSVDYLTGEVTLADDLGREPTLPVYELELQALDGGVPRLSTITHIQIQVPGNHPPVIAPNSTWMSVKEGLPPRTIVGRVVATDEDVRPEQLENELHFNIADKRVPFRIYEKTGVLTTTVSLDYETTTYFEFDVHVYDSSNPPKSANATLRVKVENVNDHHPLFNADRYEGTVTEDDGRSRPGQQVLLMVNITAVDYDADSSRDDIFLSLEGDLRDFFTIDSADGRIFVSQQGVGKIDREKYEIIYLKVVATDAQGRGLSSQANLTIHVNDVNDFKPQFTFLSRDMYVNRNVRPGENIGRLYAHDGDATSPNNQVAYVMESDSYGKFQLDLRSGLVSVTQGIFYQPRQDVYVLQVAARDMGLPSLATRATITVRVLKTDFNDYRPEFHGETIFYVEEESPPGTVVGALHTNDEDNGSGTEVSLSIDAKEPVPFRINPLTGEIRTTHRIDCDSGRRAFSFTVYASDNGDPPKESQISVGVIILDINDNPPRFTQAVYHHRVSDAFPAGTVVATPFAYDDVDTPSAKSFYSYSLQPTRKGMEQYLVIDPHTAVIRTTEALRNSSKELTRLEYRLVARDKYKEQLGSSAMLMVDLEHVEKEDAVSADLGQGHCCLVPCLPEQGQQIEP